MNILNKKNLFLAAALSLAFATSGFAANGPAPKNLTAQDQQTPGYGQHRGYPGFQQLAPEKQTALTALASEHHTKMYPIHEQIRTKTMLLDALSANAKTEPQQLTTLVNEIATLRQQLYTERTAFQAKVKKDIGVDMMAFGHGRGGYGHKNGGMGGGYGHRGGGHRGGYGGHRGGMGGGMGGCPMVGGAGNM